MTFIDTNIFVAALNQKGADHRNARSTLEKRERLCK